MDDLTGKIGELAVGAFASLVLGFLSGRAAERAASRARLRTARARSLDATQTYLVSGLDNLLEPNSLPARAEYEDKNEGLIGDADLFERWLALTVECRPMRGELTNEQLGRVGALRTDIVGAIQRQRAQIDSGQAPLLADLDRPNVHRLRVALDNMISGSDAP